MKYRVLGRTGLKVSELGMGGHEYRRWLPGKRNKEEFLETQPQRNKLIETAVNAGVNYFDTTFVEEAESLGLALKSLGGGEDVHVSVMTTNLFKKMDDAPQSKWREITVEEVEEKLRALQTDRVDIFCIGMVGVNYSREKFEAALKVLAETRGQGKIGSIGASTHELRFLAELIRKYDCFDSVMVRYNYQLQEARETIFTLCKAFNIGLVIMKPFSWPYYGISFTHFAPSDLEAGDYTPAQMSLKWILKSPEVSTIVPGINTLDELDENLAAITKEGKIDEEMLERLLRNAQSPEAKEKLTSMLQDSAIDISHFAKGALSA